MANKAIAGVVAGAILTVLAIFAKIPLDLMFLIWQLLFALTYWMPDEMYLLVLQGYIGFLLFVIGASIATLLLRRRQK